MINHKNYAPDSDLLTVMLPDGGKVSISRDEHGEIHIHALDSQDNQKEFILGEEDNEEDN